MESTRDANVGSILGWGFPVYTGGTAQFVNHVGVARFVERANELAKRYGELTVFSSSESGRSPGCAQSRSPLR